MAKQKKNKAQQKESAQELCVASTMVSAKSETPKQLLRPQQSRVLLQLWG